MPEKLRVAFEQFDHMLRHTGQSFTMYTTHKPLTYALSRSRSLYTPGKSDDPSFRHNLALTLGPIKGVNEKDDRLGH